MAKKIACFLFALNIRETDPFRWWFCESRVRPRLALLGGWAAAWCCRKTSHSYNSHSWWCTRGNRDPLSTLPINKNIYKSSFFSRCCTPHVRAFFNSNKSLRTQLTTVDHASSYKRSGIPTTRRISIQNCNSRVCCFFLSLYVCVLCVYMCHRLNNKLYAFRCSLPVSSASGCCSLRSSNNPSGWNSLPMGFLLYI